MTESSLARFCILPAALALAACSPSIDSFKVENGGDIRLVDAVASIRGSAVITLQTPQVFVTRTEGAPDFRLAGNLVNGRLEDIKVPEGALRFELRQPYKVLFTPGTQVKTRQFDTVIPPPSEGCFFFDPDTGGWTTEGFFELVNGSPNAFGTRRDLCAGEPVRLFTSNPDLLPGPSPVTGADFRSLVMPLGRLSLVGNVVDTLNPCFSAPPAGMQSQFVVADLVSPPLAGLPGWSTATGFSLHARGAALTSQGLPTTVSFQLILTDQAGATFAEPNPQGNFLFHNVTSSYQAFQFARPGGTVGSIRVRIFSPRVNPPNNFQSNTNEVTIDRVCPVQ